jgi:hypothetical protein
MATSAAAQSRLANPAWTGRFVSWRVYLDIRRLLWSVDAPPTRESGGNEPPGSSFYGSLSLYLAIDSPRKPTGPKGDPAQQEPGPVSGYAVFGMRFLFVGGCERSGTSLMQKLLCLQPRIAGTGEFVYTARIAGLYSRMAAEHPEPWASRLRNHFSRTALDSSFRQLYRELLRPAREAGQEITWVAEKTPSNIFAVTALAALFPDAKFLHVVRDGRDVLASHRDVRQRMLAEGSLARYARTHFSVRRVSARWNAAAAAHRRAAHDPELENRYLMVRYEDLVSEPQTELQKVGGFLGLELESRTLRPEQVPARELGLPIDGLWTTEEADLRGFAPERNGRWRRRLPLGHRVFAHLTMGVALAELGYPMDPINARASRLFHRLRRAPP